MSESIIYYVSKPRLWAMLHRLGTWLIRESDKRNIYTRVS